MIEDLQAEVGHADLISVRVGQGELKTGLFPVLMDRIKLIADISRRLLDSGKYLIDGRFSHICIITWRWYNTRHGQTEINALHFWLCSCVSCGGDPRERPRLRPRPRDPLGRLPQVHQPGLRQALRAE